MTHCFAIPRAPSAVVRALHVARFGLPGALALLGACSTIGATPVASCFHANEAAEVEIGYCQARRDGLTLHVSGITGQGEMGAAVRSAYERLARVLEANGYTFADIVKENVYATDLDAFIRNKAIRKEFYRGEFSAATWVQVQRLYLPSLVVEVEVTAVKRR